MEIENETGLCFEDEMDGMSVSVSDVKFSFPGSNKMILNSISFDVPKSESAIIMGSAGSGKSTLMTILAGINEVQEGVTRFNGLSIDSLHNNSLRQHIGYALSNNQIFQGTLLENISMGRDHITTQDVVESIEMVNLGSFIKTQPMGLSTQLNPEGQRIPRSAINKIILARAIVSNPTLLLLEDPLDHVPVAEKDEIIRKLTADSTPWSIIVTAVDPVWTKYISHSIELDNGKVINDTFTN